MSQWFGKGFGHNGSTSKIGACTPAASTADLFSTITVATPSAKMHATNAAPIVDPKNELVLSPQDKKVLAALRWNALDFIARRRLMLVVLIVAIAVAAFFFNVL